MAANEISNSLHAGGLLLLRPPSDGGPLIAPGSSWGLKSIRYQNGNPMNAQPPAFFVTLEQPLFGPNPFDVAAGAQAYGYAVATPQVGSFDGIEFVPFITYAGLIPEFGPEPGGVRIFMQDPRTPNTFVDGLTGPITMSLLVMRAPLL